MLSLSVKSKAPGTTLGFVGFARIASRRGARSIVGRRDLDGDRDQNRYILSVDSDIC